MRSRDKSRSHNITKILIISTILYYIKDKIKVNNIIYQIKFENKKN